MKRTDSRGGLVKGRPSFFLDEEAAPRGIPVRVLLEHVRNTAPFLFDFPDLPRSPFIQIVKTAVDGDLDHVAYFRLCVAAHFSTVTTFVPTDVDNQIRHHLWHPSLSRDSFATMTELVLESQHWDVSPVSRGLLTSEVSDKPLSGHDGEWFTIATAAYCAMRFRLPEEAEIVAQRIREEIQREATIFDDYRRQRDGVALVKAAAAISHNLGDLDRVLDMWAVTDADPLRAQTYALTERGKGPLATAGSLYRNVVAAECNRPYALRKPKCLRRSPDFILRPAPFLDDWGRMLASHPQLSEEDVGDIAEALIDGWQWLIDNKGKPSVGYARALAGIVEGLRGGEKTLCQLLPAKVAKAFRTGHLGQAWQVPRRRFEDQWKTMALNHVKNSY